MLVSLHTFGCTQNNYETQVLRRQFQDGGDIVIEAGAPDAVVINSCAVTNAVARGVVELAKRMRKKYPDAAIAIVGCYGEMLQKGVEAPKFREGSLKTGKAQFNVGEALPKSGGFDIADIVLGVDKTNVVDIVRLMYKKKKLRGSRTVSKNTLSEPDIDVSTNYKSLQVNSRSLLSIQNGCNCGCTYCIVPSLRGASASKPPDAVFHELDALIKQGCKDVVIAGINIGLYRSGGYELIDILEEMGKLRVNDLDTIRLCSLEPMSLSDRFIDGAPRVAGLCPHFHVSLQSGCDATLSRMKRNYTFERYYTIITRLRNAIPGASISTDVIVGFPGESETEFTESCENIAKCQFSDIHIFKYSQRPGTAAAGMDRQVPQGVINARAALLEGMKIQTCYDFNSRFVGAAVKALLLKRRDGGIWDGVTEHDVSVEIRTDGDRRRDGGLWDCVTEHDVSVEAQSGVGNISENLYGYADVFVTGLGKGCGSFTGYII